MRPLLLVMYRTQILLNFFPFIFAFERLGCCDLSDLFLDKDIFNLKHYNLKGFEEGIYPRGPSKD